MSSLSDASITPRSARSAFSDAPRSGDDEDAPLLSDEEARAAARATARGVASLFTSVIALGVLTIVCVRAFVGPDFARPTNALSAHASASAPSIKDALVLAERLHAADADADAGASSALDAAFATHEPSLGRDEASEAHRRGSSRTDETRASDSAKTSRRSDWHTPTFVISLPGRASETKRLETTLAKLKIAHGPAAVRENVRLVPGVDPTQWPRRGGLERAVYGLKTVFALLGGDYRAPDFHLVEDLPWINVLATREEKTGRLAKDWRDTPRLAHHVGCLFAHMAQWQLAADEGLSDAYLLESDGLDPSLLSVPVGALGAVAQNAPSDYDIVIINQPLFAGGELFSRFADKDGVAIEMRAWRQEGVAGLGAYLFSDRFVAKIFAHVARHGADMVDAWLIDKMCAVNAVDANDAFVGFGGEGATRPVLKCYHALGVQAKDENGRDPNPAEVPPGTGASEARAGSRTPPERERDELDLEALVSVGSLGNAGGGAAGRRRAAAASEARRREADAIARHFRGEEVEKAEGEREGWSPVV